jgi:hypothetical protein
MVHIDSAEKSLNLQCGDNAATLSIVGTSELIPAGGEHTTPYQGSAPPRSSLRWPLFATFATNGAESLFSANVC